MHAYQTRRSNAARTSGAEPAVQGAEFGINGYLTEHWEIAAGYTLLDPKITSSTITGEVGRLLPNTARGTANLWVTYESDDAWRIGAGMNYVGHRFADTLNAVNIPGYIVWNAMLGYKITDDIDLQFNIKNITDRYYYDASTMPIRRRTTLFLALAYLYRNTSFRF